ncbi:MAG: 50S ribosomal protein L17 [Candidatus Saccharimonadales bacterium]
MHRHGYQGRKLHRNTAQRLALLRGLSISLIEHGTIETTLPRAKELVPFIEPIITKSKRGDLASRRAVISALNNISAANTLVDQLASQMSGRVSGHVRIKRTRMRLGDNAQLATVSFVDTLTRTESSPAVAIKPAKAVSVAATAVKPAAVKKPATKKAPTKKPAVKKEAK